MEPAFLDYALSPEGRSTFRAPDRVWIYRTLSEEEPNSPFGEIAGYPIVRQRELRPEEFARAIQAIHDASASAGSVTAACFLPHHALRFEQGERSIVFLLCFTCANAVILEDGARRSGFGIGKEGLDALERLLAEAPVPTLDRMPVEWFDAELERIPQRMRRRVATAEWVEIRTLSPAPREVELSALLSAAAKNRSPWPSMERYPAERTVRWTGESFVRIRRFVMAILKNSGRSRGLDFRPTHTVKFGRGSHWVSFTLCPESRSLEARDSRGGHWQAVTSLYSPAVLDAYVSRAVERENHR